MAWADDIHLEPNTVIYLAERFLREWELPDILIYRFEACDDEEAYVIWGDINPWTAIHFCGYGTTLETLAHELAHVAEGEDAPTHDPNFNFLRSWIALLLREWLRETWGKDTRDIP